MLQDVCKVQSGQNFIQNHNISVHITDVATVMIWCFIAIDEQQNSEVQYSDGWVTI